MLLAIHADGEGGSMSQTVKIEVGPVRLVLHVAAGKKTLTRARAFASHALREDGEDGGRG